MKQILGVLGRVILISFGLLAIVAGGLCTVLGGTASSGMAWMAVIGIVTLGIGIVIVWAVFHSWLANPTANPTDKEPS